MENDLLRGGDVVRVLSAFANLPTGPRLLCFFDDLDSWELKTRLGTANRGISGPVKKGVTWDGWPLHVFKHFYDPDCFEIDADTVIDFAIYLHRSSCHDPVGMTMTFAHELQHFIQHADLHELWEANERFKEFWQHGKSGVQGYEFPLEIDARIVAKRIAIRLHGCSKVEQYIDDQMANSIDFGDRDNWRFIKSLDASRAYDLEIETAKFAAVQNWK